MRALGARLGRLPWPMIVAVPAAGAGAVRAVRPLPDRPERPVQPLRLERARATRPTSSGSTTSAGVRRPGVPRRAAAQRASSSCCRCCSRSRSRSAWRCCSTRSSAAARCCARCSSRPYVLSEVVTGVVWRQILRPDGLLDQSARRQSVPAGSSQEWLADPDIVLYSLFFVISWKYFGFHMVILLAGLQQIPKELDEAAAIDGASKWQSVPPRHAAAARADAPRVGLPVDHRRAAAVRPRLGHHQGRPDRRLVDDGDVPRTTSSARACSATPAPSRSSSSASRSSSRCSTSGSRCAATFEGLVSLAERDVRAPAAPSRAPRPPAHRSHLALPRRVRRCWSIVVIPLRSRCSAASATTPSSSTDPVGLPDPWVVGNYTRHPQVRRVLAPGRGTAR